jgi:hypothetical protein
MDRPGEDTAWAELLARWDDEGAHRAYLDAAAARGLAALGGAGQRYRDALAARPGDPIASRGRDEVLRRALAQGLAQLPRTAPAPARHARLVRGIALALAILIVLGAAWVALRLFAVGAF